MRILIFFLSPHRNYIGRDIKNKSKLIIYEFHYFITTCTNVKINIAITSVYILRCRYTVQGGQSIFIIHKKKVVSILCMVHTILKNYVHTILYIMVHKKPSIFFFLKQNIEIHLFSDKFNNRSTIFIRKAPYNRSYSP